MKYTVIYTHTHTYTYTYMHTHTYTYIYTHIHIHTHTYTHIHICIHTRIRKVRIIGRQKRPPIEKHCFFRRGKRECDQE